MSTSAEPKSASAILRGSGHALSRLRQWLRRRSELDTIDRCELERIAADLGMTGAGLRDLAARGPHAADQLRERMHLLGITGGDVERAGHGLMWDLERTCIRCNQKRTCRKDLAALPNDPSWEGYCPNAVTLTAVRNATRHFPTP